MPILNINGQIIDFPDVSESPNWADALIQFAQAVEGALAVAINQYDVPPQVFTLDAYNGLTAEIANLVFPPSQVRACTIFFSVWRKTSSVEIVFPAQSSSVLISECSGIASTHFAFFVLTFE